MSYKRGQAPGDLDSEGLRKFTEEQLLRIQRATTALQGELDILKVPGTGLGGGDGGPLSVNLPKLTNSLGANVALNNAANYFQGPIVAQGTEGVWFASGNVTVTGSAATEIWFKLWDGTTVVDSGAAPIYSVGARICIPFSGYFTNPAGDIRVSCRDPFTTTSSMEFNRTGNSKDSTISVVRIG